MKVLTLCLAAGLATSVAQAGGLSELLPGTRKDELAQITSPDGGATAVLTHKERHGMALPPEPPKTLERWSRLTVISRKKTVYDSGDERLNLYQMSPGFALDMGWSPNSNRLAFRHIGELRVIGLEGKATTHGLAKELLVTSFRWIDADNLLVVAKKQSYPLGMHGQPFYFQGYIDRATEVQVLHLNVLKGFTELYRQAVSAPTFLFHSVAFRLDEISPRADRVAFSDGSNLCIYDVASRKVVVQTRLPQKPAPKTDPGAPGMDDPLIRKVTEQMANEPAQLEGVWWQTNDTLVIGMGLLSGPTKSFYTYDIPTKTLTDKTDAVLPGWNGSEKAINYQDAEWYRSLLK